MDDLLKRILAVEAEAEAVVEGAREKARSVLTAARQEAVSIESAGREKASRAADAIEQDAQSAGNALREKAIATADCEQSERLRALEASMQSRGGKVVSVLLGRDA